MSLELLTALRSPSPPPSKEEVQAFFFRAFEAKVDFAELFGLFVSKYSYSDAATRSFFETADEFCWIAELVEVHRGEYLGGVRGARKASIEAGGMDVDDEEEEGGEEDTPCGGPLWVAFSDVTRIFEWKPAVRGALTRRDEGLKWGKLRRAEAGRKRVEESRREHKRWRRWAKGK
ncbi:hypothetical protein TWF481_010103 [Arthrobotrys musiformis]|uniref:Uncharacterized protein n=1 Tax=Arthrobotrys musiformis TaxID=47236 RepID=A0AAV9VZX3_9PEZI